MTTTDQFKIVNWNCHSLYTKLSYFKLRLYTEKPHIVCLCETWLKKNRLPSFINYKHFSICRPVRAGGGISILVRNDLCVSDLKLIGFAQGNLEVQAVTVHGQGRKLDIMNLYNPGKSIAVKEFEHYFSQLGQSRIIVGDFNAHNHMWDIVSVENATGSHLADVLLNDPSLCLLTPLNMPTYYHVPTRQFSTLDLCIVSVDLYSQSNICTGEDIGSDHAPVYTEINFSPLLLLLKEEVSGFLVTKRVGRPGPAPYLTDQMSVSPLIDHTSSF